MLIICHRRNTPELLASTPCEYGVEIDIRSYGSNLIVHHDPFNDSNLLEDWLEGYKHKFIILNTKEEGLEPRLLMLMKHYCIEDFFFLDQSFPSLIKTTSAGESRCAVRVSEYESVDTALSLTEKVQWIWIDIFTRFPLDQTTYKNLKKSNFKLCLVSPELQGHKTRKTEEIQSFLQHSNMTFDAVCTKNPEIWIDFLR